MDLKHFVLYFSYALQSIFIFKAYYGAINEGPHGNHPSNGIAVEYARKRFKSYGGTPTQHRK